MEWELIKLALSEPTVKRLENQEIIVSDQRGWIYAELSFFPLLLILYITYILPFKNTFTVVAFAVVLISLFILFVNSLRKLLRAQPIMVISAKGLKMGNREISWQEVQSGVMIRTLFDYELILELQNDSEVRQPLVHVSPHPRKIHVHLCKYLSLSEYKKNPDSV